MRLTRNRVIGTALVVLLAVLGIGQHLLEREAIAQTNGKVMVPKFEVDPFWPKPMPNNWVFGQTIGLGIDEKDQVWIIHRGTIRVISIAPSWRFRRRPPAAAARVVPPRRRSSPS